jgi:ketosteroid isomerase-like protein
MGRRNVIKRKEFHETNSYWFHYRDGRDRFGSWSGASKTESNTPDNYVVHCYGDTAVMMHRATMKGQFKGEDISGVYQNIHVFVKRDGRWQVVANQSTRVAQK